MPRAPKRPGAVMTAAVLLFVYGGLMLVSSCCGVGQVLLIGMADENGGQGANVLPDLVAGERAIAKEVPSYLAVQISTHAFNLLIGGTMVLAGIGVLQLRPAARGAAIMASATDIFLTLIVSAYNAIVVLPVNDRLMAPEVQNMPPEFGNFLQAGLWGGVCFGIVFTLAFCGPIILTLNLKTVRDAFAGKFPKAPPDLRRDEYDDDDDHYGGPRSSDDTGFSERRN